VRFAVIDCDQRSPEWRAARAGRATASRAGDVLAKIKSGEAAARRDYRLQLAVERLIGQPQDSDFVNKDMQRGIDLEPTAVAAYEAETGEILTRTGFLCMSDIAAGASLDGHVDDYEGVIEIKCPKSATHVEYLRRNRVPPEYVPQATHELWVTGAKWLDFVSFDDRLPPGLRLLVVRAYRQEFDIEGYEKELTRFLAEVTAEVQSLTKLRRAA
jgi:hypothetical protein